MGAFASFAIGTPFRDWRRSSLATCFPGFGRGRVFDVNPFSVGWDFSLRASRKLSLLGYRRTQNSSRLEFLLHFCVIDFSADLHLGMFC